MSDAAAVNAQVIYRNALDALSVKWRELWAKRGSLSPTEVARARGEFRDKALPILRGMHETAGVPFDESDVLPWESVCWMQMEINGRGLEAPVMKRGRFLIGRKPS